MRCFDAAGGAGLPQIAGDAELCGNERCEVVVRYADRDLLESGWLIGEQVLAKKRPIVVWHDRESDFLEMLFERKVAPPSQARIL